MRISRPIGAARRLEASGLRAAQYVRMSTESQEFSTANQVRAIAAYAAQHGLEIVRTYADEARSGLRITRRTALQRLLQDVVGGAADFDLILVYDVSRWGRFQDADESAHYEFLCKQAGVRVRYCAELFGHDDGPMSTIGKAVKRVMAAEYSRELSVKVMAGLTKIVELGFHTGAPPAYGLRRVLVRDGRKGRRHLRRGEIKDLASDRIVLVPGPRHETETVREIFEWFVNERLDFTAIAGRLNAVGVSSPGGGRWAYATIRHILQNEIYIGNHVWAKTDTRLQQPRIRLPRENWVRKDGVLTPIVDPKLFADAATLIAASTEALSNEEVIRRLKALLDREGALSHSLINAEPGLPTRGAIAQRFGSIDSAYELAGFVPRGSYRYASATRLMRRLEDETVEAIALSLQAAGVPVSMRARVWFDLAGGLSLRIQPARPGRAPGDGSNTWLAALTMAQRGDWTLIVRPDLDRQEAFDYLLLPRWGFVLSRFATTENLDAGLLPHRLIDMEAVCRAVKVLQAPPERRRIRTVPCRYDPLRDYLAGRPETEFVMKLERVATIIGRPLPGSANNRYWWENGMEERHRSVQAKAWMAAGYRAFLLDNEVLFTKIISRRRGLRAAKQR